MSYKTKNKGMRTLAVVLALLLILMAIAGVIAYFSDWFTDWSKFEVGEQTEQTEEESNSGAIFNEGVGNGVKLMSTKIAPESFAANNISSLAETAYTLTATIEPDTAKDKTVDWSIAFVNPSSEWATGKTVTDYVTVTPTSDGALTANVECLQPFGEQVKVTVTSRDNAEASASCMVDYAKRIEALGYRWVEAYPSSGTFTGTVTDGIMTAPDELLESTHGLTFGGENTVYSIGTVDDTFTYTFSIVLNEERAAKYVVKVSLIKDFSDIANGGRFEGLIGGTLRSSLWNSSTMNTFRNDIARSDNLAPVDVVVKAVGAYSTYEQTVSLKFSDSALGQIVENVSLDNDSLIF